MRPLSELIVSEKPAINLLRQWIDEAAVDCDLLPPSAHREQVIFQIQITTQSTLGAIAYETGGILIQRGWLRFLGSGHLRLARTLPDWNYGPSVGFYLVADDAAGGFCNRRRGFGNAFGQIFYWQPDSLY